MKTIFILILFLTPSLEKDFRIIEDQRHETTTGCSTNSQTNLRNDIEQPIIYEYNMPIIDYDFIKSKDQKDSKKFEPKDRHPDMKYPPITNGGGEDKKITPESKFIILLFILSILFILTRKYHKLI